MKFSILILIMSLMISGAAHAQASFLQKQHWVKRIDSCRANCDRLALEILNDYKKVFPDSHFNFNPNASFSLLYLHSFTMRPLELWSFHSELIKETSANTFAPVLTAHHSNSKPQDYAQVKFEDWILDAELSLKLVSALGKPVIVQGFSMGALLALHLATEFPDKITKLVLMAPAIMIRGNADDLACLGKTSLAKYIATQLLVTHYDQEYLEKYLNGACPLSDLMKAVRGKFPLDLSYELYEEGQSPHKRQKALMEQIEALARSIKAETLVVYANDDEAVDTDAMTTLASKIPHAKVIQYEKQYRIGHMGIIKDPAIPNKNISLDQTILDFMK